MAPLVLVTALTDIYKAFEANYTTQSDYPQAFQPHIPPRPLAENPTLVRENHQELSNLAAQGLQRLRNQNSASEGERLEMSSTLIAPARFVPWSPEYATSIRGVRQDEPNKITCDVPGCGKIVKTRQGSTNALSAHRRNVHGTACPSPDCSSLFFDLDRRRTHVARKHPNLNWRE